MGVIDGRRGTDRLAAGRDKRQASRKGRGKGKKENGKQIESDEEGKASLDKL